MCENTVTTWANHSQEKERIEYETRLKISNAIQRKINIVKEGNISGEFLLGLELANALVLDVLNVTLDDKPQNPLL
jgi:hypothetical protein